MILIIGDTTKNDKDWVPFEIEYAVDTCGLPFVVVYIDSDYILNPSALSYKWPAALKARIENKSVKAIHIPFKKEPLKDAVVQFNLTNKPKTSLNYYTKEAYAAFGIKIN